MNTIRQIIYDLYRQFPDSVSTWGRCHRNCGGSARGSGVCRQCLTADLAALVGKELAEEYLAALENTSRLRNQILEKE